MYLDIIDLYVTQYHERITRVVKEQKNKRKKKPREQKNTGGFNNIVETLAKQKDNKKKNITRNVTATIIMKSFRKKQARPGNDAS